MNKFIKPSIISTIGAAALILASAMPALALDYEVDPTGAANIGTMSANSTASFLTLFTANWPTIATFAITILGFFFIWRLLVGFFKGKHN